MPALIRQPLKTTQLHTKPVAAHSELTQYTALMQIPKHSEVGLECIIIIIIIIAGRQTHSWKP